MSLDTRRSRPFRLSAPIRLRTTVRGDGGDGGRLEGRLEGPASVVSGDDDDSGSRRGDSGSVGGDSRLDGSPSNTVSFALPRRSLPIVGGGKGIIAGLTIGT